MSFKATQIGSLNKHSHKNVARSIDDELIRLPTRFILQWYQAALDSIKTILLKQEPPKQNEKRSENIFHFTFRNSATELINILSTVNSHRVQSILKDNNLESAIPTVIYNLRNPFRSKVFNLNSFVSSIDIEKFIVDPISLRCNCAGSPL